MAKRSISWMRTEESHSHTCFFYHYYFGPSAQTFSSFHKPEDSMETARTCPHCRVQSPRRREEDRQPPHTHTHLPPPPVSQENCGHHIQLAVIIQNPPYSAFASQIAEKKKLITSCLWQETPPPPPQMQCVHCTTSPPQIPRLSVHNPIVPWPGFLSSVNRTQSDR